MAITFGKCNLPWYELRATDCIDGKPTGHVSNDIPTWIINIVLDSRVWNPRKFEFYTKSLNQTLSYKPPLGFEPVRLRLSKSTVKPQPTMPKDYLSVTRRPPKLRPYDLRKSTFSVLCGGKRWFSRRQGRGYDLQERVAWLNVCSMNKWTKHWFV